MRGCWRAVEGRIKGEELMGPGGESQEVEGYKKKKRRIEVEVMRKQGNRR